MKFTPESASSARERPRRFVARALVEASDGSPCSTTEPSARTRTRVACARTKSSSWLVMKQPLRPCDARLLLLRSRSPSSSRRAGSSDAVGSSRSRSGGSSASAPGEHLHPLRLAASRPASARQHRSGSRRPVPPSGAAPSPPPFRATRPARARAPGRCCRARTECSKRWWNWKTAPTWRRTDSALDRRSR